MNRLHQNNTTTLTTTALLLALNVILSEHLSISTEFLKANFGFVPVILAAMIFGPKMAMVVAGVGDLVGFFVFPQVGAYFPGFSITAALTGLVYGLLLYSDHALTPKSLSIRAALAALLVNGVLYTGLNSIWLGYLYGVPYIMGVFPVRVVNNALLFFVQLAIIPVIYVLKTRLLRGSSLAGQV